MTHVEEVYLRNCVKSFMSLSKSEVNLLKYIKTGEETGDWRDLFEKGCCFHFALKLNEVFKLHIYFTGELNPSEGIHHCWAQFNDARTKDDMMVDINGIKQLQEIGQRVERDKFLSYLNSRGQHDSSKRISQKLDAQIYRIAEKIISEDPKFQELRDYLSFSN